MTENLKEEIFKTEARIMAIKQDMFYLKEELEMLEYDLQNMKKIQQRQDKS